MWHAGKIWVWQGRLLVFVSLCAFLGQSLTNSIRGNGTVGLESGFTLVDPRELNTGKYRSGFDVPHGSFFQHTRPQESSDLKVY